MFSWILALTLYVLAGQTTPALALADLGFSSRSFLPAAKTVEQPIIDPLAPIKKDPTRLGIETESRAAVVMDWNTNKFLFRKNGDEALPIASITKLVTALVVLESNVGLDDPIEILSSDSRPGGIPYVVPGEKIKIIDLLHASLISSANGAAVALSRSIGLSHEEFVAAMNSFAVRIGMNSASFAESTGLSARNVASAKDVAILIKYALQNKIVREIVLKDSYEFDALTGLHHSLVSTDALLGSSIAQPPYGFLGGKTGFLEEAGYCFGAAAKNSQGDQIVAVVLGASSKKARFDEVSALMYWTFDAYSWSK
ncbi:serine hydrolase [Patescibacteria group bacterium]|nr:serine hydrolase [Patescibacteria group bacterium]MBU1029463.1 serine hydrolase [Patescibacteria group bacterium]MBU1916192.1 serine hydrolase [Patescibacteria group bacterium]